MSRLPTLFVSHGAPDTAVADTEATAFLKRLAGEIDRPTAIVVASAHYEASPEVRVTADAHPETIYDFGGFDPRLREMRYAAPGDPALAERIVGTLVAAGFTARAETSRGFDHGTWVPLILAFPEAEIPVVQVSIDPDADPSHHYALGQALSGLRDEGVLVIGSGSFTHNLAEAFQRVRAGARSDATPSWVSEFADWMSERIVEGDEKALLDYRQGAPFARENHPTDEHLLPLYVAMGAAGRNAKGRKLHDSRDFGVLSMAAFAFD